jgi:hypothetical protein
MRVYLRIRRMNALREQIARKARHKKATVSLRVRLERFMLQQLKYENKIDRQEARNAAQ